ncbi:MAG: N-acetylmuramoyl-L-alanine amidase [Myxococcota bacterium]
MSTDSTDALDAVKIYDLRSEQKDPHRDSKQRNGKTSRRDVSKIDSIVIHQTGVKFGAAQYQIDAAGGDRELALARRSLTVACHVMAFHDGFVAWPTELSWYIYHANKLNGGSLGIEIDGNYPGLVGGQTNNGKEATEVTDAVVTAAQRGVKLLYEEGKKLGCPIQYIFAHRQSSGSRRADPGEALWRRVVLDYAIPVLGLEPRRDFTIDKGRTVPKDWDPDGTGSY